ncbi:MAG: thermonuclease family protein [Paracoccaceae bacterium]|nr:thermonuclease family protein [Paracoccaceae bacterium]
MPFWGPALGVRARGHPGLKDRIGGQPVACEERERDRYGRMVAVCRVRGEDINAWMVAEGWVLAYRTYSHAYVDQETVARTAKRGVWRGELVEPWAWRRGERLV